MARLTILCCVLTVKAISFPSAQNSVPKEPLWTISITLQAEFPQGLYCPLEPEILFPLADKFNVHHSMYGTELFVSITSNDQTIRRPSHVVLRIAPYGFKAKIINTGILHYSSSKEASTTVHVTLEPDDVPKIDQIVRSNNADSGNDTYEIALVNPSKMEVAIDEIRFIETFREPFECGVTEDGPPPPFFTFSVSLSATGLIGNLQAARDSFIYPLPGQIDEHCDHVTLAFEGPFNWRLLAGTTTYIRLTMDRASINSAYKQVDNTHLAKAWSFDLTSRGMQVTFLINHSLEISGVLPSRATK